MLSLLPLAAALARPPADPEAALVEEHVLSVLTSSEYGASRRRTVRWAHTPTVAVIGGDDAQRVLAARIIAHLSEALAPSGLSLAPIDSPDDADIRLYIAPPDALYAIADAEGFSYVPGNDGLFWTFWNLRGQLTRAVVLVTDDYDASDPWLQHLMLEELTQSLGLMSDSPRFPESVVYETAHDAGHATALSPLDQQTLSLLYAVRPGTWRWRVRRAWRKTQKL